MHAVARGTSRSLNALLALSSAANWWGSAAHAQCAPEWSTRHGRIRFEHRVQQMLTYDDGAGESLLIGLEAPTFLDPSILQYRDDALTPMELPMELHLSWLRTMFTHDPDGKGGSRADLYLAGSYGSSGRVVRRRGEAYEQLGGDFTRLWTAGEIYALAIHDDGQGEALFAGGWFDAVNGQPVTNIAKWNGKQWHAVGGFDQPAVLALATFDDDGPGPLPPALYAAGDAQLSRWDGVAWSPLGGDPTNVPVGWIGQLLTIDLGNGPSLFLGGYFTAIGANPVRHIARWDGQSLHALGDGVTGAVYNLTTDTRTEPPRLLAVGDFAVSGGNPESSNLAAWDGAAWIPAAPPYEPIQTDFPRAAALFHDGSTHQPLLFVGGNFSSGVQWEPRNIARTDGHDWRRLDNALDNSLLCIQAVPTPSMPERVFLGGRFVKAGPVRANHVVALSGRQWSSLGAGTPDTNGRVLCAAAGPGEVIYAGGAFVYMGDVQSPCVAMWDGDQWVALGSAMGGFGASVQALLYHENDPLGPSLYAGGTFTTAGGVPASRIARWDGAAWSPVGLGLNSTVTDLELFDLDGESGPLPPRIVASGSFNASGATLCSKLAYWDGSAWGPLEPHQPIDGVVEEMQVFDEDDAGPLEAGLYIGGSFSAIGSAPVRGIARWRDGAWSGIGAVEGVVRSFTVCDDDGAGPHARSLFVGGQFSLAGGVPASNLARWDGDAWFAVGAGLSAPALALGSVDGDGDGPLPARLYVGGDFETAGGAESMFLAEWRVPADCCAGDANGDRVVDFLDLNIVLSDFGMVGSPGLLAGDLDGDGDCDFIDLNVLLSRFGMNC